ncbi:MAG: rhodanese-like domain-containing protein [Steroidobacteraceae bacterium]
MAAIAEIRAVELKRRLDAGEKLTLLDVREPWEVAIARIPGSLNIPLGEVPQRLGELDSRAPLVVMCKVGGRSLRAAQFLAGRGFGDVANLSGGIDAWTQEVDPGVPMY